LVATACSENFLDADAAEEKVTRVVEGGDNENERAESTRRDDWRRMRNRLLLIIFWMLLCSLGDSDTKYHNLPNLTWGVGDGIVLIGISTTLANSFFS